MMSVKSYRTFGCSNSFEVRTHHNHNRPSWKQSSHRQTKPLLRLRLREVKASQKSRSTFPLDLLLLSHPLHHVDVAAFPHVLGDGHRVVLLSCDDDGAGPRTVQHLPSRTGGDQWRFCSFRRHGRILARGSDLRRDRVELAVDGEFTAGQCSLLKFGGVADIWYVCVYERTSSELAYTRDGLFWMHIDIDD